MNRPPRFGSNKYEMPKEPRSATELLLRQLGLFAILGGFILFFYVMGFWDELIVEVKKLFSKTKHNTNQKTNDKTSQDKGIETSPKAAEIETKKDA